MVVTYHWTGIGARKTPKDVLPIMSKIARKLENSHKYSYILRSGGSDGADSAFERGISRKESKEIYLPWRYFNGSMSQLYNIPKEAYEMAKRHHPYWDNLSDSVRALMARNVLQVLGGDLKTPSKFVICWTPDGCESRKTRTEKTGGTGLAISIASEASIPVYNLMSRGDTINTIINFHLS